MSGTGPEGPDSATDVARMLRGSIFCDRLHGDHFLIFLCCNMGLPTSTGVTPRASLTHARQCTVSAPILAETNDSD